MINDNYNICTSFLFWLFYDSWIYSKVLSWHTAKCIFFLEALHLKYYYAPYTTFRVKFQFRQLVSRLVVPVQRRLFLRGQHLVGDVPRGYPVLEYVAQTYLLLVGQSKDTYSKTSLIWERAESHGAMSKWSRGVSTFLNNCFKFNNQFRRGKNTLWRT